MSQVEQTNRMETMIRPLIRSIVQKAGSKVVKVDGMILFHVLSPLTPTVTWHETVNSSEARDGGCDQFCDLDEEQVIVQTSISEV